MKKILATLALLIGGLVSTSLGQSYSAATTGLASAASATDIFTIAGSSSKTIVISRIIVSCTQTTAGSIDVQLVKRSTADTAGTSTNPTAVKHDSQNPAATATLNAYTANPTTGTLVGNIGSYKLACLASGTASPEDILIENFGLFAQPILLRGTAEQFAVNLNAVTVTGGSFDVRVEWTEQ